MIIKLLILSFIIGTASAQKTVKDPVIIRNEDFKKGITMDLAIDQIYKKIIPKKSTKDLATCFWMLGDKKYIIVYVQGTGKELEIEPMMLTKLEKPDEDGAEYLINLHERVTIEGLKQSVRAYRDLARANDVPPLIMVGRNKSKLAENVVMLKALSELGIKKICIAPPKPQPKIPELPRPGGKRLPASPHRK